MKNRKPCSFLIALVVLFLLPTAAVLANSMPPPFQLYLRFFSSSQTIPEVQAVQLVGCADTECLTPEYLVTYGDCNSPGCYGAISADQQDWKLECAGARCLFESGSNDIGSYSPMLKIVTDIGDQALGSEPVKNPDCQYCTVAWKIDLGKPAPVVALDEDFDDPEKTYGNFFTTYGFTVVVEALSALLFFLVFAKRFPMPVKTWLPAVLLANLLSYPVSWLVLPSLFGQFQTNMFRRTAIMVIVTVSIVTAIALVLRRRRNPVKKGVLIALIVAVPICAVLFFIGLFVASYGNSTVHVAGLPWPTVVVLAEIFAVLFETFFIWQFLKEQMKLQWVAALVLFMNAVSLVLGLVIF